MLRQTKRLALGGLDLDTHVKLVSPDDYVYALNIHNSVNNQHKHNIITNVEGTRLVSYSLPAGTNKVIGRFEDTKDESCIYLVWNSNGQHSVLRYYLSTNLIIKVLQEPLLNFQQNAVVGSINLVDDLFSFTDGVNPPREFNLERAQRQDASGVFKTVEMNVYFDLENQFVAGNEYRISFIDLTNTLNTFLFYTSPGESLEDGIRNWVAAFNANTNINTFFVAESCGTFIEVSGLIGGIYDVNFGVLNPPGNPKIKRVFTNIYPNAFLETFINADKNPPECEPSIAVRTDTTEHNNFIISKIFQIRAQYVYVDGEDSALSPISTVSLGVGNYIEVDFTDTRLNDENLTIIDGVRIYVKQGETGKWSFVKELERFEFGIDANLFKFFNNNAYQPVDDALAVKLFDSFPIVSEAQEVADNRKLFGDITEGYDRECVETSLSLGFKQPPQLFTIKGIIVIRPLYMNSTTSPSGEWGSSLRRNSAIFKSGSQYFFGTDGFTERGLTIGQEIPLQGFVCYLAGTDFYGITKQVKSSFSTAQESGSNAYLFTAQGRFDVIAENQSNTNNDYLSRSRNPFGLGSTAVDQNGFAIGDTTFNTANGSNIYQTFEINGVPEGEYTLRVAGTETTLADLASTGYQKTSTYCIAIGSAAVTVFSTIPQGFEVKVKVGATQISFNTTTAANAGNVIYVGCSAMADLTTPIGTAGVTTGYLCDSDLSTSTGSYNSVLTDTRIERALVGFNNTFTPVACKFNTTQNNWADRARTQNFAVTDHNGFFYHVTPGSDSMFAPRVGNLGTLVAITTDMYRQTAPTTPIAFPVVTGGSPGYTRVAIRNTNNNIRTLSKTYITGRVLDGTTPQENVSVTNVNGSWQRTDELGNFQIPDYIDTFAVVFLTPPFTTFTRRSEIIFSSINNGTSVYDFVTDSVFIGVFPAGITIGAVQQYDNTAPTRWYIFSTPFQADFREEFLGISAFKRGLKQVAAVVYFDRENRQTTVNDHIREIYVPFYTENQIRGAAEISWAIMSLPPVWATHYQWVRLHSTPFFLQFNITSVSYVDANDNSTSFTSAAFVKIGFNSILDYKARYPNSILSYTFEAGDRIRFIANNSNGLFANYLDAEVVKDATQGNNYFIYVEKNSVLLTLNVGTLFELYTPKPADAVTFYEFGECFEIGNPHQSNRFHKGLTQDQDPNNPVNVPATGTFRTGDVYYRFRNFVLGGARYVEDSNVSDFYESFTTQTGRPQILNKNAVQIHRPGAIRISNKYFSGTKLNGFASFEALNVNEDIETSFGGIRVLKLMSQSVLLAVCVHRTQPFYVGRAVVKTTTGSNLISIADDIIDTADTLIGNWGTQHKLSFDSYNNNAWWNDESKGAQVRYSSNGLFPISDYKVKSFFNDRGLVKNSQIIGGYDAYHDDFVISWGDLPGRAGETIVFNEGTEGGKNRWTTFYSFIPECFGRIGNVLLSFQNGALWIHDNPTRNAFYGTQYSSHVKIVANDNPSERKTLQASTLESLNTWETTATVPPNNTRPLGQITRIKAGRYIKKEGQWFAEFYGDINSPGGLANGEKLVGETFEVLLVNDAINYTELFAVDISHTESPRNSK